MRVSNKLHIKGPLNSESDLRINLAHHAHVIFNHHAGTLSADSESASWIQTNMATDELEEINGIKPNVWLQDGEEREVGSQTR